VITGRVDSGPNSAERARTVLAHAPTLTVEVQDGTEVVGVRAVDTDGSLLLMVSAEGLLGRCVAAADVPATVHAARLIPLLGPDRVLDAVSVYGSIRLVDADDLGAALEMLSWADPGLSADLLVRPDARVVLRVGVTQVGLDGDLVDPGAYGAAACDPLAAHSDEFVADLVCRRPQTVMLLAHLLDAELVRTVALLAPIRLDRHGLTFRLVHDAGTTDERLDFPQVLTGPAELPAAMAALQERATRTTACPFSGEPGPPCRPA
jgi:hypothetical protein